MKKNVSSQVIGAQMVSATDGSAFTGSVTCYVTGDGGTQAAGSVGSGACTHEGNGFHTYAPAQAETNYNHAAFTFVGTGAVPVTIQVYTTFPQTGDAYARLGAPVGASISADISDIDTDVDSVLGLLDNERGEPGQGAPPVNPDAVTKIDYLYKAWRNKKDNDGTVTNLYADDGSTVDHKQSTSEAGGTVTKGEWISGA